GPLLVKVVLLDVGKDQDRPGGAAILVQTAGGEEAVVAVEVVDGQPELAEVVGAGAAVGGLAHSLDGRHEECNEYGDDGNDDQQLDQREADVPAPDGGSVEHHVRPPLGMRQCSGKDDPSEWIRIFC